VLTFLSNCVNADESAVSQQGQVAPRTGFMYNFHQKETLIRVWDAETEGIYCCVLFL